MQKLLKRFLSEDLGATAIEYGLLSALVSVSILVVLIGLGDALVEIFAYIAQVLNDIANNYTAVPAPDATS